MKLTDPSLILEFLGNDLEPGHSTTQTLGDTELIRGSFQFKEQRLNGLKSSSDQVTLQIRARCSSTEDIIATDGDIKAVLKDGDTPLFTGYVSTRFSWSVTANGEQAINITLESVGTRLFDNAFIETGKHFFDCSASAAIYTVLAPLGISIRSGDERLVLQNVKKVVEAGETCRQILDQLLYECNAVYYFNAVGEFCIWKITADTTGAQTYDSDNLMMVGKKVVSLSKQLRTYKGARVAYDELAQASNYLIYRNTTGQSFGVPYCNLVLAPGYYWDGAEMFTPAEWSAATADTFREPTLIGAVNAASESSIVGSGEIVNIANLTQRVEKNDAITFSAEIVGGPYFKMLAHNTSGSYSAAITRLDLSADITYVKSHGVIRTQIDGSSDNKTTLEEELSWIHDKDNASLHANLLAQYHKSAGAAYTFYTKENIVLGSVIKIHDNVYSGLNVYVLVTARQSTDKDDVYTYTAVGISSFDLSEQAYHGTTETAHQSGAQGPQGEPGATAEVQYAIGSSIVNPPGEAMQWGSADMLWGGDTMFWNTGTWADEVPEMQRGMYIWMRTRTGDAPWQYTRLTGTSSWDPQFLGTYDSTTGAPTQTPDGMNLVIGDCFTATETWSTFTKGVTYMYTGAGWADAGTDNPRMLLDALSAMKEKGIDFADLNDPNTISWFTTIIADTIVAKTIKALQGIFESITVSGKSSFEGNITSQALKTFDASSGGTASFTSLSGSSLLPQARVMSALGGYGSFMVTGGSFTVKDPENPSSTPVTYTASPSNPFKIVFSSTYFGIVRSSDGVYLVRSIKLTASLNYELLSANNTDAEITSCSLTLADTPAGASATILVPEDSNASIGTKANPFPSGWFGDFETSLPGGSTPYTSGHCTLTNGLILKWGHIPASENDGVSMGRHNYTAEEGGAFPTSTLAVFTTNTTSGFTTANIGAPGTTSGGQVQFVYWKYNYSGSTITTGMTFNFLAIGY